MAQTIDTARLAAALEKLATDPKTLALIDRMAAGAAKAPVSAKLAGVKTYIVAGLGVLGTALVVLDAFVQHGGLTLTGWLAAIVALVTSTGFATLRSALSGHYGEVVGMLLNMGQSIALEVAESQGVSASAVAAQVVVAAPEIAAGAITAAPAVAVQVATEVAGDVAGGLVGGLASILGGAAAGAGVAPPVQPQPKAS